jgi:hypothetical protein
LEAVLGPLPLMLARRGREILRRAGLASEIVRDDVAFGRAQADYTAKAGLAYLRVASFDPEAFGLCVDAERAVEAARVLLAARIPVSVLGSEEGEGDFARPVPAGEPAGHPYRGSSEERVCLRCGEPEAGARPPGAPCARCGGVLASHEAWLVARRRVARRWAALFVLALVGLGVASPRFVSCRTAVHLMR